MRTSGIETPSTGQDAARFRLITSTAVPVLIARGVRSCLTCSYLATRAVYEIDERKSRIITQTVEDVYTTVRYSADQRI